MDFLEFSDIHAEIKGAMCPGRLKLTDQHMIFKNNKTGKVEQISSPDIEVVNWQRLVGSWGLRIFLKNGSLHRFGGIKESEQEKIAKFFSSNYKKDVLEKELSLKGWNWGTAKFDGSALSFVVGNHTGFEIPLNYVSQCTTGKNEVTLEFHQNDDASVGLMEMRFHIPPSELAGDVDPVDAFHQQVMKQASVINLSGETITIFKEIQCLTPRGRYDIKVFPSFFQLHGKTFDYKIPMSTVIRLFILPHKDSRQMFFVVSLDPPIKQGQTRYHYLVFQFGLENEVTIELPLSEEEIQEKYEGKLSKEMTGPTYEVLGRVMKAIVNRKITTPGNFVGHSGTPAIGCSYKAAAGYLYPLERGFIYIHKPPVHLRFDEITSVNFARSGGGTRSFDFEVETKSGVVHTFSSIEKDEYAKLFDFITSKKLRVKNRGKNDKPSYTEDFGDSDQEDGAPDAYLARVKAEAQERDDDDGGDSEESTDEDFNPDQQESDVAEEYDSNPTPTDSDDSDDSGGEKKKKEKKKEKKEPVKRTKTVSEKPRKRREKKDKDENRPKRPATAFMIWLNEHREQIKSENPGITVTEIAKKAGEMWKEIKDKSIWEAKVAKAKEEYVKAMKEYNESGGAAAAAAAKGEAKKDKKETKKKTPTKSSPVKSGAFKSKEYISDDDSSSADDKKKKKAPPPKPVVKQEPKSDSEESSDDDKKKKKKAPAKPAVRKEPKSDSDDASSTDDAKKKKKKAPAKPAVQKEPKSDSDDASSSDDAKKKKKSPAKVAVKKEAKSGSDDASSSDDAKKKKKPPAKVAVKKEAKSGSDDSGSDTKKPAAKKAKTEETKKKEEKKKASDDDDDDDEIDEPIESTPPTTEDDSDSGSD